MADRIVEFVASHWGDIASVAGLGISVIGFVVTVKAVLLSKSSAVQTREATEKTRVAFTHFDTVAKLSSVITSMNEIKRLHRIEAWRLLPDRYAAIRQDLVLIRSANPGIGANHRSSLNGAIQQFAELENVVEKSLSYTSKNPPRPSKAHV